MIVECPKCNKKHNLDDSHVTKGALKVRCLGCQHVWNLTGQTAIIPRDQVSKGEVLFLFTHDQLERLFRLRLVVARFGEMDLARWWNTQGMLGRRGAVVLRRGFPTTYLFAQARVVFAVARSRCNQLFSPPGCMTLWNLPAEVEDQFEDRWQTWLDQGERWKPFFEELASLNGDDLLKSLSQFSLISQAQLDVVSKLRRSAEGRAIPLPGTHRPNDEIITLLAAGFARGEPGNPAIPYARLEAR